MSQAKRPALLFKVRREEKLATYVGQERASRAKREGKRNLTCARMVNQEDAGLLLGPDKSRQLSEFSCASPTET